MSDYSWKVTPQNTIEFYAPDGSRLATLDTADMDDPIVNGVASEEAKEEADLLVEHLNNPLPGDEESEYTISQMSFGMMGPDIPEGDDEDEDGLVDVESPDGERIASITSFEDGDALLQHFNRNSDDSAVH